MERFSTPVRSCGSEKRSLGSCISPVRTPAGGSPNGTPIQSLDHKESRHQPGQNERSSPLTTPYLTFSKRKQRQRCLGSSSRKGSVGKSSPGRFIPRRATLDVEVANFSVNTLRSPSTDWSGEVFEDGLNWGSKSARESRRRLACLSEGASEQKVLNFHSDLRSLCTDEKARGLEKESMAAVTYARPERRLPKYPEKILDLPNLEDDFFTHTLSWSSSGYLVAGLESRLYTCSGVSGTTVLNVLPNKLKYISVACNADGSKMAAGTCTGEIEIWELESGKKVETFRHGHYPMCGIRSLDWNPITDILASGCGMGSLDLWDLRSPDGAQSLEASSGTFSAICGLRYSPNGAYLAASSGNHVIRVWETSPASGERKPIFQKNAHTSAIRALAWYPFRNSILASGGGIDDGHFRLWNVITGEKLDEVYVHAQVCELIWSPETKELISSQSIRDQHSVVVWRYPELTKVGNLTGHSGRVLHMALSPCKRHLATASADETLRIWELKARPQKEKKASCATPSFLKGIR